MVAARVADVLDAGSLATLHGEGTLTLGHVVQEVT